MIQRLATTGQTAPWQREMAEAITDPAELIHALGLDRTLLPAARRAAERFGLRVPRPYLARMRRGDPSDPLLRQVLPLSEELQDAPGYVNDPVGDGTAALGAGLLQKYAGRVLLVTTGACAVHCRYCFRRHFPYAEDSAGRDRFRGALAAIRADDSIHEVILSGGDPLSLSDRRLAELVDELDAIPQLRRLRIHTRQPIVLPSRVDEALLDWVAGTRLKVVVVLHANHPQELDAGVATACAGLAASGATLLNQSVLLSGVNDDAAVLSRLSEVLFDNDVLPYYLHMLDPVAGAAHFDVEEDQARDIHRQLMERLPGYLVPRLVRELPGEASKTPVDRSVG